VFLVSLSERGEEVEVSLVCVRADGGVPPQFSCTIAVVHWDDGTRQTLESPAMKSSSLTYGTLLPPGDVKWLKVKKEHLLSDEIVPLTFRLVPCLLHIVLCHPCLVLPVRLVLNPVLSVIVLCLLLQMCEP
jgi:hypothetical protein